MENKSEINESQYPSVGLAYESIKSSYDVMISRFEAANARIQNFLTWVIGITAIIPIFTKIIIGTENFKSIWFILSLLSFLAVIIVGIVGQRAGTLKLIDPKIIYEKHLYFSQWEFKKNQIYWAGEHFSFNNNSIELKSRYLDILTMLFGLEIVFVFIGLIIA
jgi:hypothetical protein